MKMLLRSFGALAILCASLLVAVASEPVEDAKDAAETDAEARLSAMLCDRYGPGYKLVPGTTTCVKVGGYISVDAYTRFRKGQNER
jgi:hypothetical protein